MLSECIPDRHNTGIHDLGKGVSLEWVDKGKILMLTLPNINRATIDCYIETCIEIARCWPAEERVRVLHDVSHKDIALTPYLRQGLEKAQAVLVELDLQGVSAVVTQRGFIKSIMIQLGKALYKQAPNIETHYFHNRDKALAWLRHDVTR